MKQLMQKLRDGTMEVLQAALPVAGPGMVLVQNHFSLISAGTEGSTVTAARKSLIGKAKERPDQVRQVIATLRQQGPIQTYRAASKKLDSYSPLGYSCAGTAIDVGENVRGISVGDRVACAGAGYAVHAEVVAVPQNLCAKLEPDADLCLAAYNTLGAIALQGIRQADLRLGETCVVIGLGLLGQLTCLLLRASGVRVIGLDINARAVATAVRHCADQAYQVTDPAIVDTIYRATGGVNADAVIITAATTSTEPVNLAGKLLRKRGTVVIVGDVPTGFHREPDYYKKELTLRMSCSYGPGRYDLNYEEKGLDYPPGYVRWTENRNMQAFQSLIHIGSIDLGYMTTHRFSIDNAPDAYELILKKTEDYLGVILEYDADKTHTRESIFIKGAGSGSSARANGIGFIGAGSYAMSHLLPNLGHRSGQTLRGVMTSSGTSSRTVAEKYGFAFAAASAADVIGDGETGTVFIATRHDSHAEYVTQALQAGKNVFVEKPLCLTPGEIDTIANAWNQDRPLLTVGFNRRFAPLARELKAKIGSGPLAAIYRVNAGAIPGNSWIQDQDLGGGRIIGEVCHFVDFLIFVTGSLPQRVHALAVRDPGNQGDTVSINLSFEDGSIATIAYFANGAKSLAKEYVEIYKAGMTARLMDFKQLEILGGRKSVKSKLLSQDKGQKAMVDAFLSAVAGESSSPIPLPDSLASTSTTFGILESIRRNQAVDLPKVMVTEA